MNDGKVDRLFLPNWCLGCFLQQVGTWLLYFVFWQFCDRWYSDFSVVVVVAAPDPLIWKHCWCSWCSFCLRSSNRLVEESFAGDKILEFFGFYCETCSWDLDRRRILQLVQKFVVFMKPWNHHQWEHFPLAQWSQPSNCFVEGILLFLALLSTTELRCNSINILWKIWRVVREWSPNILSKLSACSPKQALVSILKGINIFTLRWQCLSNWPFCRSSSLWMLQHLAPPPLG